MTRRRRAIGALAVAVGLIAATGAGSAQWVRYPTAGVPRTGDGKPNLQAPAPRLTDGRPDFSGVWQNDGFTGPSTEGVGPVPRTVFFDIANGMKEPVPYQPWAAEVRRKRREDEAKDNPDARCLPIGPLQMLAHPLPKKIVHVPGLLVLLHERNMEFRQIFTDGRPLPADQQPSWYGYSTARWERDTLVVETSGLRDELWADFWGSPLTGQARMTERIHRPTFGTLEIQVTVNDPKAYTRPWTLNVNQRLGLDLDLLEYACLENEKDVPRLVGK